MKTASALLFAGAAAASYDYASSAAPAYGKPLTTINPCPDCPTGIAPPKCTVTAQHQTVSTCHPVHGKASCSSYAYVHTVLTDKKGYKQTVTKTDQPVTVCHTKSTITHTATVLPTAAKGYGHHAGYKNATAPNAKVWYELYEKTCEAPYNHLGPIAMPGYPGSGFCTDCENKENGEQYQEVEVKECYGGKCHNSHEKYTHGAPTPSTTTYEAPGTYTVPAYDMTVDHPTTLPAEAYYTAPAGEVTYGGMTTYAPQPTTMQCPYASVQTEGGNTKTVIVTKTIVAPSAGTYTVVKPTTTHCEKPTVIPYPTISHYWPGVYHHSKETVTITKSHEPYTCHYQSTSTYPTYSTPSASGYPSVSKESYPTASTTTPYGANPSDDVDSKEEYGTPYAGYVKRGGMIERSGAKPAKAAKGLKKRVILV